MTPRVLYDFVVNTGKFYDMMCSMARNDMSVVAWRSYLIFSALPTYRIERREPYEGMSVEELTQVATELRDYYVQHLKEA